MKVYVRTPSRLHLGIVDVGGELGRIYGSIGVAIQRPSVMIKVSASNRLKVIGEKTELVGQLARKFFKYYGIKGEAIIDSKFTIPEHVGLGSGTQLTLALAVALAKIFKIKATVREIAEVMGRGLVSGIGTAVFERGGFIFDGGKKLQTNV
ncbi:MAG: beta-ribofuranosylaminobenzene 5'-phosphate synthase family protein, partial [Candidatus Bathyarchaeota archaeon]